MKLNNLGSSNIESIEFTSEGLIVNYLDNTNRDFIGYENFEGIEVFLIVKSRQREGRVFSSPSTINIKILYPSKKDIILTTPCKMSQIYELLDCKRYFKKFSFKAEGNPELDKFIRLYAKFGIKFPFINKSRLEGLETFSCVMFVFASYLAYQLNVIENPIVLAFLSPFIIVSILSALLSVYQEFLKYKIRRFLGYTRINNSYLEEGNYVERKVLDYENGNPLHSSDIEYLNSIRPAGIGVLALNIIGLIVIAWFNFVPAIIWPNNDSEIIKLSEIPNSQEIEVNNLSELDGYSKSQVYSLRKRYVADSIFDINNYEPNEQVFGGVQDGKYWYGTENLICYDKSKSPLLRAEGDSYVSRLINNPAMLIGLDLPYVWNITGQKKTFRVCTNGALLFIPDSITYSPEYNLITVKIKTEKRSLYSKNYSLKFMFNGLNARDLGYKWGYAYNKQNIQFVDNENAIDKKAYEFRDYIAVGGSCRIEGGCNNLCPMQDRLMFFFRDEHTERFSGNSARIDFKLWKEKPNNVLARPDIYYRIIFEDDERFKNK